MVRLKFESREAAEKAAMERVVIENARILGDSGERIKIEVKRLGEIKKTLEGEYYRVVYPDSFWVPRKFIKDGRYGKEILKWYLEKRDLTNIYEIL